MVKDNKNLIVGLDIGTSKIVASSRKSAPSELNVIGWAPAVARRKRRRRQHRDDDGLDPARAGGGRADGRLPDQGGLHGIAGSHIRCYSSHGWRSRKRKYAGRYRPRGRDAKTIPIPNDQQIHIVRRVHDRRTGRFASHWHERVRLEVVSHRDRRGVGGGEPHQVHPPLRPRSATLILQPLASATAVLSDDEKDLGVCLIDIGGGTSDIAYAAARFATAVIPIAATR
jgi:cell division protein FtsA